MCETHTKKNRLFLLFFSILSFFNYLKNSWPAMNSAFSFWLMRM